MGLINRINAITEGWFRKKSPLFSEKEFNNRYAQIAKDHKNYPVAYMYFKSIKSTKSIIEDIQNLVDTVLDKAIINAMYGKLEAMYTYAGVDGVLDVLEHQYGEDLPTDVLEFIANMEDIPEFDAMDFLDEHEPMNLDDQFVANDTITDAVIRLLDVDEMDNEELNRYIDIKLKEKKDVHNSRGSEGVRESKGE